MRKKIWKKVLETIYLSSNPITSREIRNITGLNKDQVDWGLLMSKNHLKKDIKTGFKNGMPFRRAYWSIKSEATRKNVGELLRR